jgi:hypothetical protein
MASRTPNNDKDEPNVPWTLLVCLLVMALVLVIALPMIGIILMDANNATNAALTEVRRMRELRLQILKERDDNRQSTQATPTEESLR